MTRKREEDGGRCKEEEEEEEERQLTNLNVYFPPRPVFTECSVRPSAPPPRSQREGLQLLLSGSCVMSMWGGRGVTVQGKMLQPPPSLAPRLLAMPGCPPHHHLMTVFGVVLQEQLCQIIRAGGGAAASWVGGGVACVCSTTTSLPLLLSLPQCTILDYSLV